MKEKKKLIFEENVSKVELKFEEKKIKTKKKISTKNKVKKFSKKKKKKKGHQNFVDKIRLDDGDHGGCELKCSRGEIKVVAMEKF